jgi:hypothetical protein
MYQTFFHQHQQNLSENIVEALSEEKHRRVLFRAEKDVQAPSVVHQRLQATHALVFDLFVFAATLAFPQEVHDLIDARLAELFDPTDGIAGEGDTKQLDTLVDFVRTSIGFFEVVDVVARLFEAGVGAMFR